MFGEATARIRGAVGAFASGFDADRIDVAAAQAVVREWSAIENTAATIKSLAAARIATAERWDRTNGKSAADWLAGETGTTASRAREQIETGRKLRELDGTAQAAKRGELSPEQATAIADAAAADPSAESGLLETAKRGSLRDLRDRCAATKARADTDPDATRRRIHAGRRLKGWTDKDGVAQLHASGPVDLIARVTMALGPIAARLFTEARRDGRREDPAAYAFDALVELADDATAGAAPAPADDETTATGDVAPVDREADRTDAADGSGGEAAPIDREVDVSDPGDGDALLDDEPCEATLFESERASASDCDASSDDGESTAEPDTPAPQRAESVMRSDVPAPARPSRPGPLPMRFRAVIRVDYEALLRGSLQGEETCEIAGLGPIPVRTARDLLGEATMHLVITKGVDVANLTYLGRSANAAQRIALLWQMPMCIVEGCQRRAHLQYDHEKPFVETKHTRLDELSPKCEHHHALKTHKGWELVDGDGRRPMVPPDHPEHPKNRHTPKDDDADAA